MTPIERALAFLNQQQYPVGVAWLRHRAGGAPAEDVLATLAPYQAEDGGFGGLEVDIGAPGSNPFATRMAMQVLSSLEPLTDAGHPLIKRLASWLETAQAEDGDWHFRPDVYEHRLAPWFAGWTFPSLNPSGSIAGLAALLGLGSEQMHARVRRLYDERATLEQAATADFYTVLPYFEYFGAVEHPQRDAYLDALATNVVASEDRGGYDDAGHIFSQLDGGWPSPYDPAWRLWSTASNGVTLARYGRV